MFQKESKSLKSNKKRQKSNTWFFIFFLAAIFIFSSCANIVMPSGGEKDLSPPKLIASSPKNKNLQFKEKKISFYFDETVQLKNPESNILISPLIENVVYKVKNKRIDFILPDEPLLPNTSYTINFNGAVVDATESNIALLDAYTFSTGTALDTLMISGTVFDAEKQEAIKDVLVAIYADSLSYDSLPKRVATVFTYSSAEGKFSVGGLQNKNYQVLAFLDANKNRLLDPYEEAFASSFAPVLADTVDQKIILNLSTAEQKNIRIKEKQVKKDRALIILNKKYLDVSVRVLDTPAFIWNLSPEKDSIQIYYSKTLVDTSAIVLLSGNDLIDTLQLLPSKTKGTLSVPLEKNDLNGRKIAPGKSTLTCSTDYPYTKMLKDSISLSSDEKPVAYTLDTAFAAIRLNGNWEEGKSYTLKAKAGAFLGYNGQLSKESIISFSVYTPEETGTIVLKINGSVEAGTLVELLNEKKEVVQSLPFSSLINFSYLKPGDYYLRLLFDSNKNGRWDSGDYYLQKQAEKVLYYSTLKHVRPNWDNEFEWNLP